MTTSQRYPSIVDGIPGAYTVTIPDFAGCVGKAEVIEDAVAEATTALSECASRMILNGEDIPQPRDAGEILEQRESGDDPIGVIYIPLALDAGRTVRASVSFDAALLQAIDNEANRRGLTRSAFLATAARGEIERAR